MKENTNMNKQILKKMIAKANGMASSDLRRSNRGRPKAHMSKREVEIVENMLKAGVPSIGTIYTVMKAEDQTGYRTYPKFIRAYKENVFERHIHHA